MDRAEARLEETLRLCDQTLDHIVQGGGTEASESLIERVRALQRETLGELNAIREHPRPGRGPGD